jgi:hypothetical protein
MTCYIFGENFSAILDVKSQLSYTGFRLVLRFQKLILDARRSFILPERGNRLWILVQRFAPCEKLAD